MSDSPLPRSARAAGIMTAGEMHAAGLSEARIKTLVKHGRLRALARGIYAPAGLVDVELRRPEGSRLLALAVAVTRRGPQAAGSHTTAAIIYGLDLLGQPSRSVEVTLSAGATTSRKGAPGVRLFAADLPVGHVTAHRGVPVTTVARTVVDVARGSSFVAGVVTADSALRQGKATRPELESMIADCVGWPGIQRARRVVSFSDSRAESAFESLARVVFHQHRLPAPELQAWVGDADCVIGRVDFLWRRYRTIAEADGVVKYGSPQRAVSQLRRDTRLRAAGFEVIHFTWPDLTPNPTPVITEITNAFRRAIPPRAS